MTKLEEAEHTLRDQDTRTLLLTMTERQAIADELDRLRAEVEHLRDGGKLLVKVNTERFDALSRAVTECNDLRAANMATDAQLAETERQLDAAQRELRKARAELAALKGEAECTRWTPGDSAGGCISDVFYATPAEAAEAGKVFGFAHVFAVRMSARKVTP